jgi:proliferating cell nuclear antigen
MEIKMDDYAKIDILTNIFQNIKLFTDNICIHFFNEKMQIQTMDTSKISILQINIPKNWFQYYLLENETSETSDTNDYSIINIGLNSNILYKILACRAKSQSIHLKYNTEETDKLYINIENEELTQAVYNRFFEIPLIDLDEERIEIPEIEYEAEISLPSLNFANIIQQLKVFGDILKIECNEQCIMFISKSNENGLMRVEIPIDELTGFSIIEQETINVSFGLKHLHSICAYNKISDTVELKIHRKFPLQVEYVLDTTNKDTYIKYFLAPIIVDDE